MIINKDVNVELMNTEESDNESKEGDTEHVNMNSGLVSPKVQNWLDKVSDKKSNTENLAVALSPSQFVPRTPQKTGTAAAILPGLVNDFSPEVQDMVSEVHPNAKNQQQGERRGNTDEQGLVEPEPVPLAFAAEEVVISTGTRNLSTGAKPHGNDFTTL